MDAGAYLRRQLLRSGAISYYHRLYGFHHYSGDSASPACMYGADSTMAAVVEQHGNTVGGGHAYTHAAEVGHQRVYSL